MPVPSCFLMKSTKSDALVALRAMQMSCSDTSIVELGCSASMRDVALSCRVALGL